MDLRGQVRRLPHAGDRARGKSDFYTRSGLDWLHKFSFLEEALQKLPPDVIIDGEVVSAEPSGRTNFSQLQADIKSNRQDRMAYYAFDILRLDGRDLRALSLLERKAVLEKVLQKKLPGIRYSEHHTAFPKELFAGACKMGLVSSPNARCSVPFGAKRELAQAEMHPDRAVHYRGLRAVQYRPRCWSVTPGHQGSEIRWQGWYGVLRQGVAVASATTRPHQCVESADQGAAKKEHNVG